MMNFGTVTLVDKSWVIDCEPHVRSRIKRVFPRMRQHAADTIMIANTPENARELEWFVQRFPMTITPLDRLIAKAQEHRDTEMRVAEMLDLRGTVEDFELAMPARDYQKFAASMAPIRGGLMLADDLGVGKTVSAICGLARGQNLPALVVCPTHLPRQWQREINRFAPSLRCHILKTGKPYPLVSAKARGGLFPELLPDVIITNYHKLRGWAETLAPLIQYVIFDECQALRSPSTLIYSAAEHVATSARLRMGLSATPFYNYGAEIFWVANVLLPDCLGEYEEFVREWCTPAPGGKSKLNDAKVFGAYLRREGIMLRRTRRDVGRELPPLTRVEHTIDHNPEALEAIKGDAAALARIILRANEDFHGQKMQASAEFDARMRQATGVAKAPFVAEFVRMLLENGERVLLFGWHHEVYGIWKEDLRQYKPAMFTGQESPTQKQSAIDRFISGESPVLIMSLRSGAGVDGLQAVCRTVVFGELDWSPGVIEQCIGRVDRDGQVDPCTAYFMVTDDGADPIMADVLGIKSEQIEGVRNPDAALIERADNGVNTLRRLASEYLERHSSAH